MAIKKKYIQAGLKLLDLLLGGAGPGPLDIPSIKIFHKDYGSVFIAMLILKKSQEYVPVDTGALRDSAIIEELGDGKYRIIYDTPYAAIQHEDIDFQHIEPGRAKYLEDAAYEILNLVQNNGEAPLFTFQIQFPGEGRVALDINNIDMNEFMNNKIKRERLLNMTVTELWDSLGGDSE